ATASARRADGRIRRGGVSPLATPGGASPPSMIIVVRAAGPGAFIPSGLASAPGPPPILAGYVAALASLAWSIAALASAGAPVAVNRRLLASAPVAVLIAMLGVAWGLSSGSIVGTAAFWTLFGASVGTAWP